MKLRIEELSERFLIDELKRLGLLTIINARFYKYLINARYLF